MSDVKKLTGREIGSICSAIQRGSSYSRMAKKFGVNKSRIKRICLNRGVKSKHNFPFGTPKRLPKEVYKQLPFTFRLKLKLKEWIGI